MNQYITGTIIKELCEKSNLTQTELLSDNAYDHPGICLKYDLNY